MIHVRSHIISVLRCGIVAWWLIWLLVAVLFYGGLSVKVITLVLFSLLGFYLGTLPLFPVNNQVYNQVRHIPSSIKFPVAILSLIIAYQLNLYHKSSQMIGELGSGFREAYFESGIHGSTGAFVLYEQFMLPIGIYLITLWACRKKSGKWWVVFTAGFFLLDALIKAGRFPIYYFVFFLLMAHLIGTIRLRYFQILPILVVLPALGIYQLFSRVSFAGDIGKDLIYFIIEKAILAYHFIGFYILDRLMDQPVFNTFNIFPSYTLGYFQYLLSLYLRRFGIEIEYPQMEMNRALTEPVYLEKLDYTYNAFSTNLLPFYLDGGFIFSFMMFYLFGYLLTTRIGLKFENMTPINVISAFVMVFGLFQPIAVTGYFFIPIILHLTIPLLKLQGQPSTNTVNKFHADLKPNC